VARARDDFGELGAVDVPILGRHGLQQAICSRDGISCGVEDFDAQRNTLGQCAFLQCLCSFRHSYSVSFLVREVERRLAKRDGRTSHVL
jgi:hypothetical protein